MRIVPPCFYPDYISSIGPFDFFFGTSLGPYIIASLGNPFDGLTSKSPFATNHVKLNNENLIIVMQNVIFNFKMIFIF